MKTPLEDFRPSNGKARPVRPSVSYGARGGH